MTDYYRGDQRSGITPPDLSKDATYADHIVKARGKRTQYTSVSMEPAKIRDFGEQIYKLRRDKVLADQHKIVEHDVLTAELRRQVCTTDKADKLKAVQALRYAKKRLEGLVDWSFDLSGVERKSQITWVGRHIQPFFKKQ